MWCNPPYRLAAYEELYRKMKAQTVEDYKCALKEQVHCTCTCTCALYMLLDSIYIVHVHVCACMYRDITVACCHVGAMKEQVHVHTCTCTLYMLMCCHVHVQCRLHSRLGVIMIMTVAASLACSILARAFSAVLKHLHTPAVHSKCLHPMCYISSHAQNNTATHTETAVEWYSMMQQITLLLCIYTSYIHVHVRPLK